MFVCYENSTSTFSDVVDIVYSHLQLYPSRSATARLSRIWPCFSSLVRIPLCRISGAVQRAVMILLDVVPVSPISFYALEHGNRMTCHDVSGCFVGILVTQSLHRNSPCNASKISVLLGFSARTLERFLARDICAPAHLFVAGRKTLVLQIDLSRILEVRDGLLNAL